MRLKLYVANIYLKFLLTIQLNLCLTSTYSVQYNGKHYKQLHGTAMGPPVSVVAEIAKHRGTSPSYIYANYIPLRLRYVDYTFTAVYKDEIDDFHEPFNRQNTDIQFTKKIEENGNTAWSPATTTDYERHFTENHTHDLTDHDVTYVYR